MSLRDWARKGTTVIVREPSPPPPPVHRPVIYSPQGVPVGAVAPQLYTGREGERRGPFVGAAPLNPSTVICKSDVDPYRVAMAQYPDVALAAGIDLSGGVDATKLPGRPEGAAMVGWTENTHYFNGATNRDGSFSDHLARRHGTSQGQIRTIGTHVLRSG